MSEDGFTLVEMLVSIAMISMAIGGLSLGLQVLSRYQTAVSVTAKDVEGARAAQAAIERLLDSGAPFAPREAGRFAGTAEGFDFACAGAQRCSVVLEAADNRLQLQIADGEGAQKRYPLGVGGAARVTYQGSRGRLETWPPDDVHRQTLRSITIVSGREEDERSFLSARIWREQPPQCVFDVVIQDCR